MSVLFLPFDFAAPLRDQLVHKRALVVAYGVADNSLGL
jgi:hypothetical protein